jgi:predicted adenylyl cyclase CyaB
MREIEVKIIDIDAKAVGSRIRELGGRRVSRGEMHAIFYDFEDGRVAGARDLLRLRKIGGRAYLTYKRYLASRGAKRREEAEVEVKDFEGARRLLSKIGLVETERVRKTRTSYVLGDVHIEIDKYHGQYEHIPPLLEVEGPNLKLIYSTIERLGFERRQCKDWSIVELVRHYSRRR